MILDPEAIGDSTGILIDGHLEHGDAADQVLWGGVAVMIFPCFGGHGFSLPSALPDLG